MIIGSVLSDINNESQERGNNTADPEEQEQQRSGNDDNKQLVLVFGRRNKPAATRKDTKGLKRKLQPSSSTQQPTQQGEMAKSKKQNKKTSFKIPEENDSEPQVHAADLGQYSDQRNEDEHEAVGSEEEPDQAYDENDDGEEDQDYNPTT